MTGPQRDGLALLVECGAAGVVSARGNGHGFISTRVARTLVDLGYASNWYRAAGDAVCESCGATYHTHADVPGYATLRVLCGGEVVKL